MEYEMLKTIALAAALIATPALAQHGHDGGGRHGGGGGGGGPPGGGGHGPGPSGAPAFHGGGGGPGGGGWNRPGRGDFGRRGDFHGGDFRHGGGGWHGAGSWHGHNLGWWHHRHFRIFVPAVGYAIWCDDPSWWGSPWWYDYCVY